MKSPAAPVSGATIHLLPGQGEDRAGPLVRRNVGTHRQGPIDGRRASFHGYDGVVLKTLVNHILFGVAYWQSVMRTQRGSRGRFSSLYGTTTLRLPPEFPYAPGAPRYERLVFDANDQLVVPLNEWYHLMRGT